MNISFVICTDGRSDSRVDEIIDSIEWQDIPNYEVLIVGGSTSTIKRQNTRHLVFDETRKRGWISYKKNWANREAAHDVIVYLHDYHMFLQDWYKEMKRFGLDWDVQCHRTLSIFGHRMMDWVIDQHPTLSRHTLVDYDRTDLVPYQYICGAYWVSKRHVIQEEPLNEELEWCEEEDVEWSRRVRTKFKIVMNPRCIVRHNKIHRDCEWAMKMDTGRGFPSHT